MTIKILITGGNGNISKMIKSNLSKYYEILNPSHEELDVLNINQLTQHLSIHNYDILIHTAILGGRRSKQDTSDIFYKNILMFENIIKVLHNFKIIINLDSAAIYDRNTDIFCKTENDILTIPNDYYGFSKYIIYKRGLMYSNIYNLRIFNIFHKNEESSRFIKSCFLADKNNTELIIYENKYFDFVYEDDFITIIKYYIDNINYLEKLNKTINICYEKKYTLFEIAKLIVKNTNKIIVKNNEMKYNYCGNGSLLQQLKLNINGLEHNLKLYNSDDNTDNLIIIK